MKQRTRTIDSLIPCAPAHTHSGSASFTVYPPAFQRDVFAPLPRPFGLPILCRGLVRLRPQAHPFGSRHLCRTASGWLHSQLAPFPRPIPAAYDRYLVVSSHAEDLAARSLFRNSKSMLFKNLAADNLTRYELQHRNNPRRHRDPLRPAHLRHRCAARAGRSHPARAGDYFQGKRIPPGLVRLRWPHRLKICVPNIHAIR